MNLIEESFRENQEKKQKKTTQIILAMIIILVIAIIAIIVYLMYLESSTLKLTIDGQANNKLKELLVIEEDGTVYLPIKRVAGHFKYESYNGEYTEKSEEQNKCYVQSENEIANFVFNSNVIYKLDLTKSNNSNYEYQEIEKPVKAINGELYVSSEGAEKAFNISFYYDKPKNTIQIYTMPYLTKSYSTAVLNYGYSELDTTLANQKAILQNMLIVKNARGQYGVIDVYKNIILETKYDNITYLPEIGDFLVQTNGKVGIMSKEAQTKIAIKYDTIELMDVEAGLYLVKNGNKNGIMDLKGNTKLYIEYDEIGIDISKYSENNIKNKYLLDNNLIPVRQDKLWGLFDKNGNQVVDFKYDSFGYIASNNKNALNLLIIPDYNILVACKEGKYTLLNTSGEELFTNLADDIYMTISGGKKHYHIFINNKDLNAIEFLEVKGIPTSKENE